MKRNICIGLGGMFGAIMRFHAKGIAIPYKGLMPLNTLLTNLLGCFLLALILTLAYEVLEMDATLRLGIATGFLGAFTTFSTLCKESYGLMTSGHVYAALLYVALSASLGILCALIGIWTSRGLIQNLIKKREVSE